MNKYKVLWSSSASEDLKNIIDYIAKDSPGNALNVLDHIEDQSSDLEIFPERGRVLPELQQEGIFRYKELIVSPWRIIYRIENRNGYIVRVVDSRMSFDDIIF